MNNLTTLKGLDVYQNKNDFGKYFVTDNTKSFLAHIRSLNTIQSVKECSGLFDIEYIGKIEDIKFLQAMNFLLKIIIKLIMAKSNKYSYF